MSGYVYAMTNPSIPDLIKIGKTSNLKQRLNSLYCTAVPTPFECILVKQVKDTDLAESLLHKLLKDERVNESREFFKTSKEKLEILFKLIGLGSKENRENQKNIPATVIDKTVKLNIPNNPPAWQVLKTSGVKEMFDLLETGWRGRFPKPFNLPKYSTVISQLNKGWTMEQAFGFEVPPNYSRVDKEYIQGRGFRYFPDCPKTDGNRVPLVCEFEKRIYISQDEFAKANDIPKDYVSDKLKNNYTPYSIIRLYKKLKQDKAV